MYVCRLVLTVFIVWYISTPVACDSINRPQAHTKSSWRSLSRLIDRYHNFNILEDTSDNLSNWSRHISNYILWRIQKRFLIQWRHHFDNVQQWR